MVRWILPCWVVAIGGCSSSDGEQIETPAPGRTCEPSCAEPTPSGEHVSSPPNPTATTPQPAPSPRPPDDPLPLPADHPAPVPTGCIQNVAAAFQIVACDGLSHELSVPDACLTAPCGLIFDIHGGTMSAEMENNNTGLRELGVQHGYIVVHPSAAGGLWTTADDVKIHAFLEQVARTWHVDRKRIHMTGFSQGGYMTWRFVCSLPELFASVAPAAAAGQPVLIPEVGCSFVAPELPAEPVPILYMHGRVDGLVAFDNGLALVGAVAAAYSASEGEVIAGDGTFARTRHAGQGRAYLEFIEHGYATDANFVGVAIQGHCYPGSTDFAPTAPGQLMGFGCKSAVSFHWGQEVMAFFMAHPKP